MTGTKRAKMMGINHIALEVGDVETALKFYSSLFDFELRGTHENEEGRRIMAFLDMGDQFLALNEGRAQSPDDNRHFGLVVDDMTPVIESAVTAGGTAVDGSDNNFRDPWGNRIEVVQYRDLQFTKSAGALSILGVDGTKTNEAQKQIADKGMDAEN
ncbi:VOC family protein [Amaricoccus tamworthensis]|uniref:VOC family protein n=1 Tax=Amaricoccus tamworthensis TaxID=57002 RepID=UPI003C7CE451